MRVTGPTLPPTDDKDRWERGLDPWHKDAFPDELKAAAPNHTAKRKEGWYELDAWKNQIGFVADGTQL